MTPTNSLDELLTKLRAFIEGMGEDQLIYRRADGLDLGVTEIREAADTIERLRDAAQDLVVLVKAFGQSSNHGLWVRARKTVAALSSNQETGR